MTKDGLRDTFICVAIVVIFAIIAVMISWLCVWGAAKITQVSTENHYAKQTAFTAKYKEIGEKLLGIEGEVEAQVELANEFYKERADKGDYPHIYDKGDYSILVYEVTDGKYVSNLYGKYRRTKDKE